MDVLMDAATARRYPVGAELVEGGVAFRVWAPHRERVRVVVDGGPEQPLMREPGGYWGTVVRNAKAGSRYHFRLDDDEHHYPDLASRGQPDGPHGESQVVDATSYQWQCAEWGGAVLKGQVITEVHIGTFTQGGTWQSAREQLHRLADIGITMIEMMPINEYPGRFGWGYDGVDLFAPHHSYGTPDDLRAFIDDAHGHGIAVILDVVYNHIGPDGSFFDCYASNYFTTRYKNEWGAAMNFEGAGAQGSRDYFTANAAYWIDEFRFDGLRLDATQALFDASDEHIMASVGRAAHEAAAGRPIIIVAENEPQDTRIVRPLEGGGYGLDGLWNDDFHHSAVVALTGHNEAYYHDHLGAPQEFIAAAKYGYLFQGQRYDWQDRPRGVPGYDLAPERFIHFLQNHDQVANSGRGYRIHKMASPGRVRALTALLLLSPQTPMLFQGQEFASSTPFHYFADHPGALGQSVREGRRDFLTQFPSLRLPKIQACIVDATDDKTFQECKLDWSEFDRNHDAVRLHRDLIRLRREDPTFSAQATPLGHSWAGGVRLDGSVLSPEAFLLRFFGPEPEDDRLMIVNLGRDLNLGSIADPLAASPPGRRWTLLWSSEDPDYGGSGTPPADPDLGWAIPGQATIVLGSEPRPAYPNRVPRPKQYER